MPCGSWRPAKSKQHIPRRHLSDPGSAVVRRASRALGGRASREQHRQRLRQPEWTQLRAVLIEALSPHPEARLAVAEALQRVETREELTA
jgi:hypothetical protein